MQYLVKYIIYNALEKYNPSSPLRPLISEHYQHAIVFLTKLLKNNTI